VSRWIASASPRNDGGVPEGAAGRAECQMDESFLVLFFKKELLACVALWRFT
jgi:hypothetical protein